MGNADKPVVKKPEHPNITRCKDALVALEDYICPEGLVQELMWAHFTDDDKYEKEIWSRIEADQEDWIAGEEDVLSIQLEECRADYLYDLAKDEKLNQQEGC